jgi:hypothetical protein
MSPEACITTPIPPAPNHSIMRRQSPAAEDGRCLSIDIVLHGVRSAPLSAMRRMTVVVAGFTGGCIRRKA